MKIKLLTMYISSFSLTHLNIAIHQYGHRKHANVSVGIVMLSTYTERKLVLQPRRKSIYS